MEEAIKAYLDNFAKQDTAFAAVYPSDTKTIEGCCRYIYKHYEEIARKANHARHLAVRDEEVYSLAVTYFEEDSIKEEKPEPKPEAPKAEFKPAKTTKPATASSASAPKEEGKKAKFVQLELF